MKSPNRHPRSVVAVLLTALLASCAPLISPFSPIAYEQAVTLKIEALSLMSKATQPYLGHADEVDQLIAKIEAGYEFAKGRPKNEFTTRQWEILKNPNGNLLGGFLGRWKNKSTLSTAFVNGAKKNVAAAFDQIIQLESGKISPE